MTPEQRRERRRERDTAHRTARAALSPLSAQVVRYGPEPERLEFDGLVLTRTQWAKRLGLAGATSIRSRMEGGEWDTPRALTQHVIFKNQRHAEPEPLRSKYDLLIHDGCVLAVEGWALELAAPLGLNAPAILGRLRLGWSVERALSTSVRPHLPKGAKTKAIPPAFVGAMRPRGRPRN